MIQHNYEYFDKMGLATFNQLSPHQKRILTQTLSLTSALTPEKRLVLIKQMKEDSLQIYIDKFNKGENIPDLKSEISKLEEYLESNFKIKSSDSSTNAEMQAVLNKLVKDFNKLIDNFEILDTLACEHLPEIEENLKIDKDKFKDLKDFQVNTWIQNVRGLRKDIKALEEYDRRTGFISKKLYKLIQEFKNLEKLSYDK